MRKTTTRILFSACLLAGGHSSFAQDGSLDPSFSSDGKVITSVVGGADDYARAVAVQQDGKIIVGGYTDNGSAADFAAVRYNADGSPDMSFGSGGKITL